MGARGAHFSFAGGEVAFPTRARRATEQNGRTHASEADPADGEFHEA